MRKLTITQVLDMFGWPIFEHLIDNCGVAKAESEGVKYLLIYNSQASRLKPDLDLSLLSVSVFEVTIPVDFIWDDTECGMDIMYAMAADDRLTDDLWITELGHELIALEESRQEHNQMLDKLQDLAAEDTEKFHAFIHEILEMIGLEDEAEVDFMIGLANDGVRVVFRTEALDMEEPDLDLSQLSEEMRTELREAMTRLMTFAGFSEDFQIQFIISNDEHLEVCVIGADQLAGSNPIPFFEARDKFFRKTQPPILQSAQQLLAEPPNGYRGVGDDCKWN